MKEKLINAALWLSGRGPALWAFVDGKKTYTAAVLKMLTGLAGLIGELQPILDAHNLGAVAAFCKALSIDPNWKLLTDALAVFGLGHKLAKLAGDAPDTTPPAGPSVAIKLAPPA